TRLSATGELRSRRQLQGYLDAFRRRFGPEALSSLHGQPLLEHMHAHGIRESLVYGLEFKNDDEFPNLFGSIAGGNALKFGVDRRSETGVWSSKGSGSAPVDISLEQAIEIATHHRDHLIAATEILSALPPEADSDAYLALQRSLREVASSIEDTAWG